MVTDVGTNQKHDNQPVPYRCISSVMAEALPVNIDWKSAFLKKVGHFWPNFHVVEDVPRKPFLNG